MAESGPALPQPVEQSRHPEGRANTIAPGRTTRGPEATPPLSPVRRSSTPRLIRFDLSWVIGRGRSLRLNTRGPHPWATAQALRPHSPKDRRKHFGYDMTQKGAAAISTLALIVLILPGQGGTRPERFYDRPRHLAGEFSRKIVPNPKWITTKWVEKEDAPFMELALEARAVLATGWPPRSNVDWKAKAKLAYKDWYDDSQNPVKIFNVSVYLMLASQVDPRYGDAKEYHEMCAIVNRGWEFLEKPPQSYEFVRRGYAFSAGDEDEHDYGDIAKKLLERDPSDRVAFVGAMLEYHDNRRGDFAKWMFETAERFHGTKGWRPWDSRLLGRCYELKARETYKKKDLLRAIELGEEAIRLTPKQLSTTFISNWVKFMREKELPKMKD